MLVKLELEVKTAMMNQAIAEMVRYFGKDARRINHALKVYGFAQAVASGEKLSVRQEMTLGLAALLHDIGIHEAERKHGSSTGKHQELEGPPVARTILDGLGIDPAVSERVCFLVGNHHSYEKIDGLDFQILVEADFLVNAFEDKLEPKAIQAARDKVFKTTTGIRLLSGIYLE